MGAGASASSGAGKYAAGGTATAAEKADTDEKKRHEERLLPPVIHRPPRRHTERLKRRLHRLADPELSSSEDEEELNSPVLYLHDTRIPVGAQHLVDWLDCQQIEFQLNTIERHAVAKDSPVLIERVVLNCAQLPPWYAELEDSALDKHVDDRCLATGDQQSTEETGGHCPPRRLPMMKRGRRLYRGQLAISNLLAELFPTIEMEEEHGINHGFVQRFKDFMSLTIDLIQAACKTKVQPPSWGGPQMNAIRRGRGTDLRALLEKEHAFQKELQYIEAKLRFGDGPYIDGKVLHSVDWALGPRLQTALLAVRHFTGWDLTVPPFLAVNRYRASLLRNPAFPRLLYLNPKLMVAYHQKTRDDLVRKQTKESLKASGLDKLVLYLAKTPEMLTGRGKATHRLRAGTLSLLFGSDQARFHFAIKELPYEVPAHNDDGEHDDRTRESAAKVEDVLALEPPPDNWLLSVQVVEVLDSDAGLTDREPDDPTELEPAEAGGFLAKAVNFIEDQTGLDIDGDGDVGVMGSTQQLSEFLRDVPSGELPAIVHGPRVVCSAKAISSYLEDAFDKPDLTPDLKQAWQGQKAGLRPKAIGELFPAAIRYMYTPRNEFRLAEAAKAQFEAQLIELESCLQASGGPYLYGPLITVDDCELGPQLQSALVALQHIKGWTLKAKDSTDGTNAVGQAESIPTEDIEKWRSFPAIRRYRNAVTKHPCFPTRSTEEILALHEASIDTFVAEQLERARVSEDELITRIQYAMFGPRLRWHVSVTVVSCRNLVKADFIGKNDPYVKVTVGNTTRRTSTLTDAGADPVWGLDDWNVDGTENFEALRNPAMKAQLLENSRGETMDFVVAFPVPLSCQFDCMDEDYGPLNPDDFLGRAELKLGGRDQGGGNIDQWSAQRWLVVHDDKGQPAGEIHIRVAAHETTLEALKEESAEALLPSFSTPADEWDRECVEQISRCVAATDRAESAIREFGSLPRMLEGLGRLLDLPADHPTGWGWDVRSFVNLLHDRTAFQSVQRMTVRPGDSALMIGAGLCSATLQLARRVHSDLSMNAAGGGALCVTDPSKLRLQDAQRCLRILHSPAAPVETTFVAAEPNWQEPQHPDGRPVKFPETMAMDDDVMELSHKELQLEAEHMGLLIDPNSTTVEIQQEIMRRRRENTWGHGADAHSHLPFVAAAFHTLIVHPDNMHLRSWEMSELLRVLRPGATANIPVRPWHNDIERISDRAPGVPVLRSVADVCNELRKAGFTRVASETVLAAVDADVQGIFSCTIGSSDDTLISRANAARALQKCCARASTSVKTHLTMKAGDLDALTAHTKTLIFSSYRWIDEDSRHRGYFSLESPSGGDMDNVHFAESLCSRCPNAQLIMINACYSADICAKLRSAFGGRVATIGWSSGILETDATKFEVALFLELEAINGFSQPSANSLQVALDRAYATLKEDIRSVQDLPQPSWHFPVTSASAAVVPTGGPRPPPMVLGGRALVRAGGTPTGITGAGSDRDPISPDLLNFYPESRPSNVQSSRFIPQSVLSADFQLVTAEVPHTIVADPNCLIDIWTPGATTCSVTGGNEAFAHGQLTLELQPVEVEVDKQVALLDKSPSTKSSKKKKKQKKKKNKNKSVDESDPAPKSRRSQPMFTKDRPEEVEQPEMTQQSPWFIATGTKSVSDLGYLRRTFPARSTWYEMHAQDESTMYFEAHVEQLAADGHVLVGLGGPSVKLHEQVPIKPGGTRQPTGEQSAEKLHELHLQAPVEVDSDSPLKTLEKQPLAKPSGKPMKFSGNHGSNATRADVDRKKPQTKGPQSKAAPSPTGPAVWTCGLGGGVRCTELHTIGRWGWDGGAVEEDAARAKWRGKTRTASGILPGDVIGVAVWRDKASEPPVTEVEFSKNGDPIAGVVRMQLDIDVPLFPTFSGIGARVYVNFGRRPIFEFPPPRLVRIVPRPLAAPAEIEEPPGESEEDKQRRLKEERLKEARRRADEARQASKAKGMDFRKKKAAPVKNKKASPGKKKPPSKSSTNKKKKASPGRKRSPSP
eukprot:COSAG02_NODE_2953_length_7672_cov_2.308464_4_plen_2023_part_00